MVRCQVLSSATEERPSGLSGGPSSLWGSTALRKELHLVGDIRKSFLEELCESFRPFSIVVTALGPTNHATNMDAIDVQIPPTNTRSVLFERISTGEIKPDTDTTSHRTLLVVMRKG